MCLAFLRAQATWLFSDPFITISRRGENAALAMYDNNEGRAHFYELLQSVRYSKVLVYNTLQKPVYQTEIKKN